MYVTLFYWARKALLSFHASSCINGNNSMTLSPNGDYFYKLCKYKSSTSLQRHMQIFKKQKVCKKRSLRAQEGEYNRNTLEKEQGYKEKKKSLVVSWNHKFQNVYSRSLLKKINMQDHKRKYIFKRSVYSH